MVWVLGGAGGEEKVGSSLKWKTEEDCLLDVFSPKIYCKWEGEQKTTRRKKHQTDDLHISAQLDISNVTFEVWCSAERPLAEQRRGMCRESLPSWSLGCFQGVNMKLLREELSRPGGWGGGDVGRSSERLCKVNQICSGVCDPFIFPVSQSLW